MELCFIIKYPPIEGGVSMQNYWLSYGLAERGHHVHVVTNAFEVEAAYRMYLEDDDQELYQPEFESSGGFVKVRNTEQYSTRRMNHIPAANPFVTKLSSVATQTIREHGCELIYAAYYEPYGMAGYLASRWTETPFIIQHAGSDLDRLMKVPDLSTAYKEVLKAADCVLTRDRLVNRFVGMGVDQSRIRANLGFGFNTAFFNPQAEPMDVNGFLQRIVSQNPAYIRDVLKWHTNPIDLSKPTIGIYGKVGVFKGSFDLVSALSDLKKEGLDFNFLAMTQGVQADSFKEALRANDLEERTWILPFVPHWKVAGFIRACTAVCFLERDFPIAIHGPTVPREILACARCLLLSKEIAQKQFYRDQLVDGGNVLIINDPKNQEELAGRLRLVIQDGAEAARIGTNGHAISESSEDYSGYMDGFEKLLLELQDRKSLSKSAAGSVQSAGSGAEHEVDEAAVTEDLAAALPYTSLLLSDSFGSAVALYLKGGATPNGNRLKTALGFCEVLGSLITQEKVGSRYPYFREVFRYEVNDLSLMTDDAESNKVPPFSGVDKLCGRELSKELLNRLKPLKSNFVRTELFNYDMQQLIRILDEGHELPDSLEAKESFILFQKLPNVARLRMKINRPTADLLGLCNGTETASAVLQRFAESHGLDLPPEGGLRKGILSTLKNLYEQGVIIFC